MGDPTEEPTMDLETAVDALVQQRIAGINTGCPGMVVTYDRVQQRASVKPSLRLRVGDDWSQLPAIPSVPVLFPSGGGYSFTWPLQPGDTVWLLFADRSLDEWLSTGGQDVSPQSRRRHALKDAVAIAGVRPFSSPLQGVDETDMVLGEDSGATPKRLTIGPDGIALGNGPAEVITILSDLLGLLATTTAGGDPLSSAAAIAGLQVLLDTIKVP